MNKKAKYSKDQFMADRTRLLEIVGCKLCYIGTDSKTYRVTIGDDILRLYFDVYLSRRTVVIRQCDHEPRYYRNQSWEQITAIFSNIAKFV